ncbi:MAG: D-glycero-beta-D-manno-heptose 1-phosphate adenylyltransferase [Brevundimonas sp.]|jgi:D-beta-D-heptose 7-phosphate kinase / D-beta-D-heptose 1-phosphate adenosyltransferase|uniref:D-glycero-beta-D-manno-heptose 1-phosphate adenylyltransferase n=1 Tax=Brevundimonas sp. TaxID=1871086 RepID=UPI00391DFD29
MEINALRNRIRQIEGVRVACVGDLMLDRYVYGEVSRISPEAPIPVLRHLSEIAMPGATGNVARNVAALGGHVVLGGLIGDDEAGRELSSLLTGDARIKAKLTRSAHLSTIVKTRFVAAGQQMMRLDREDAPASADRLDPSVLEGAQAILVSDYAKGAVSADLIGAVLETGARLAIPVIVDPKGRDFARYGPVDVIKPNASELALATGLPVDSDGEIEAALAALLEACEAQAIVVTRAGRGMSIARRGGGVIHVPGRAREVFDVSGAGDTSLAALGLALGSGADLEEATHFAIVASGVVVGKQGTASVTPEELIDAERERQVSAGADGLTDLDVLLDEVATWRRQGLKIGFTNGCFDILHRGHVAYLRQARGWCDRLIVALNSDASVRALKGDSRPVNDIHARASVIAGLSSVDRVTVFDEPTPLSLIKAIRPDVLVKGADYTREGVVGADEVESWGGQVRLASFEPGFSTSRTIEKMQTGGVKP